MEGSLARMNVKAMLKIMITTPMYQPYELEEESIADRLSISGGIQPMSSSGSEETFRVLFVQTCGRLSGLTALTSRVLNKTIPMDRAAPLPVNSKLITSVFSSE